MPFYDEQGNELQGTYYDEKGDVVIPGQSSSDGSFITNFAKGLYTGVTRRIPEQIGQAMQFTGIAPEAGKSLADWAREGEPEAEKGAFEQAGEMAPLSGFLPALGFGIQMIPHPIAKLVGAGISYGAPLLFGLSQAQSTKEEAEKRGVDPGMAPYATGGIELAGETIANIALGRLLGPLAGAAKEGAKTLARTAIPTIGRMAKEMAVRTLPTEIMTEMGQNWGEAMVEKHMGVRPEADPTQEALGAIAPTAIMTIATGGLGVGITQTHGRHMMKTLGDPEANVKDRLGYASGIEKMIRDDYKDPDLADMWAKYALDKIEKKQSIDPNLVMDKEGLQVQQLQEELAGELGVDLGEPVEFEEHGAQVETPTGAPIAAAPSEEAPIPDYTAQETGRQFVEPDIRQEIFDALSQNMTVPQNMLDEYIRRGGVIPENRVDLANQYPDATFEREQREPEAPSPLIGKKVTWTDPTGVVLRGNVREVDSQRNTATIDLDRGYGGADRTIVQSLDILKQVQPEALSSVRRRIEQYKVAKQRREEAERAAAATPDLTGEVQETLPDFWQQVDQGQTQEEKWDIAARLAMRFPNARAFADALGDQGDNAVWNERMGATPQQFYNTFQQTEGEKTRQYREAANNERMARAVEEGEFIAEEEETPAAPTAESLLVRAQAIAERTGEPRWVETTQSYIDRGANLQQISDLLARYEGEGELPAQRGIEVAPSTETLEFKKWFGKSKVVEKNGKPLVVYHGTPVIFDKFDLSHADLGFHFGSAQQANARAMGPGIDPDINVMPVYLSIKNPYDIVADLGDWSDMNMLREYLTEGNEGPFTTQEFNKFKNSEDVREGLIKKGYDGIKYQNSFEGEGSMGSEEQDAYIAFSPTQIKSVYNKGTWNKEDANISAQRAIQIEGQGGLPLGNLDQSLKEGETKRLEKEREITEAEAYSKGYRSVEEMEADLRAEEEARKYEKRREREKGFFMGKEEEEAKQRKYEPRAEALPDIALMYDSAEEFEADWAPGAIERNIKANPQQPEYGGSREPVPLQRVNDIIRKILAKWNTNLETVQKDWTKVIRNRRDASVLNDALMAHKLFLEASWAIPGNFDYIRFWNDVKAGKKFEVIPTKDGKTINAGLWENFQGKPENQGDLFKEHPAVKAMEQSGKRNWVQTVDEFLKNSKNPKWWKPSDFVPKLENITVGERQQKPENIKPTYKNVDFLPAMFAGTYRADMAKQQSIAAEEPTTLPDFAVRVIKQLPTTLEGYYKNSDPFQGKQVVKTDSVRADVAGLVQEWLQMLGMKTRVMVASVSDIMSSDARRRYQLWGKDRDLIFNYANQMTKEPNVYACSNKVPFGGNDRFILLSDEIIKAWDNNRTVALENLAHEFGHVIQFSELDNLPTDQKVAITEEWNKWHLNMLQNGTVRDFLNTTTTSPNLAKYRGIREEHMGLPVTRMKNWQTFLSFDEWYADQVARWMVTNEKPQTANEKFFAKIADMLKRLWTAVDKALFRPAQSVEAWLDKRAQYYQASPRVDAFAGLPLFSRSEDSWRQTMNQEPLFQEGKINIKTKDAFDKFNEALDEDERRRMDIVRKQMGQNGGKIEVERYGQKWQIIISRNVGPEAEEYPWRVTTVDERGPWGHMLYKELDGQGKGGVYSHSAIQDVANSWIERKEIPWPEKEDVIDAYNESTNQFDAKDWHDAHKQESIEFADDRMREDIQEAERRVAPGMTNTLRADRKFWRNLKEMIYKYGIMKKNDLGKIESTLANPFMLGLRYPEIKAAVDIQIGRDEGRNQIAHDFMKMSNTFFRLKGSTLKNVEKALIEGDRELRQRISDLSQGTDEEKALAREIKDLNGYTDNELMDRFGLNAEGIAAYRQVRHTLDTLHQRWLDQIKDRSLSTYRNQTWYALLKQMWGEDLNNDELSHIQKKLGAVYTMWDKSLRAAKIPLANLLKTPETLEGIRINMENIWMKALNDVSSNQDLTEEQADKIIDGAVKRMIKLRDKTASELNDTQIKAMVGEYKRQYKKAKEAIQSLRDDMSIVLGMGQGMTEPEINKELRGLIQAYAKTKPHMQELRNIRNQLKEWVAYFPRERDDTKLHYIAVKQPIKNEDGEVVEERTLYLNYFNIGAIGGEKLKKEAEKIIKDQGLTDAYVDIGRNVKEADATFFRVSDMNTQRIINNAIEQAYHEGKFGEKQGDKIKRILLHAISDQLNTRGFGRHKLGRTIAFDEDGKLITILGYKETDLQDVMKNYITGYAGMETKQSAAMQFTELLADVAKEQPGIRNYIYEYAQEQLRNQERIDKWNGTLRGAAFVWYLGGNFKSAFVQLTQNYITGIPILAQSVRQINKGLGKKAGFLEAERRYHAAMKDLATKNLTEKERAFLDDAISKGVTMDQYISEITGRIGNSFGAGINRGIKLLSYFFSQAEIFNRKSAALAMYRLLKENDYDFGANGHSFDSKGGKAVETYVNRTHYLMGKANIPSAAWGAGTLSQGVRAAYTFRSFTHNYLLSMLPQYGGDARTALHSLAYVALLGGMMSLPWLKDIFDWWSKRTGEDILGGVRKELRKYGGKTMEAFGMNGLVGLALGDISGSLGIGVPFMGEPTDTLYGVWGGVARKGTRGAEAISHGDWYRGAENIAPEAMSNIMKSMRMSEFGRDILGMEGFATTAKGRPIFGEDGRPVSMDKADAFRRMVGFQPREYSEKMERHAAMKNTEAYFENKRRDLAETYRIAALRGDTKGKAKVAKEVQEFNKQRRERGVETLVAPARLSNIIQSARMMARGKEKKEVRYKRQLEAQ